MTAERELKLIADGDTIVPDLNDVAPGVTTGSSVDKSMNAVYYDTSTLALARWGVTLRWRDEGSGATWTVKLPSSSDDSTLSRLECNFRGAAARMPSEAAGLVRVFRRAETLGVVAKLHTTRRETELLIDGVPIATLCDDLVSGAGVGIEPVTFREIEVELAPEVEGEAILNAAARRLKKAGCVVEEPVRAKVVRVLGAPAQAAPDVVVTDVGRRASVGELVRNVLAGSVDQLIRHDPGTRLGENPEDLHQFRVAARRLRSDLGTLAPLLDGPWATALRGELRWIGNAAGVVRDADVLGARLHGRFAELSPADLAAAGRLRSRLEGERASARTTLLAALSTDRYDALIEALILATHEPRFIGDRPRVARRAAAGVVADLVAKRWHRLRRAGEDLGPESPDQHLHDVRILAKRCRYAAEAAAKVCGRDARRFSAAVSKVQDVLGDHQDTTVAEAWLRAAVKAIPSSGVAAGLAIAQERAARAKHREQFFTSVWPAVVRPSVHSWLD